MDGPDLLGSLWNSFSRAEFFVKVLAPGLGDLEDLFLAALLIASPGLPLAVASRGKVLFTLLNGDAARERYVAGHASLSGRVMFTASDVGQPEAAFFNVNDALVDGAEIAALVSAGYLVRTRADIDTLQARSGDPSLKDAAFASGAQFVSTDYLVPDTRFGTGYVVELPGGGVARCNPLASARHCDASRLASVADLE